MHGERDQPEGGSVEASNNEQTSAADTESELNGHEQAIWRASRADSWCHLLDTISRIAAPRPTERNRWVYRGQACHAWSLLPALGRVAAARSLGAEETFRHEIMATNHFARWAQACFGSGDLPPDNNSPFEWWCLMQHYGAPTRVLDWTWSPFVALYFAVRDLPDCDGCLWLCEPRAVNDRVREVRPELEDPGHSFMFPYVDHAVPIVWFLQPWRSPARIAAQESLYSVATEPTSDHKSVIANALANHGERGWAHQIIIPSAAKKETMRCLSAYGINARTLFPGPEGLGREIADYYMMPEPLWSVRDLPGEQRTWKP